MKESPIDVVIVGGGAAGFFAAGELGRLKPGIRIVMLEKTGKVLAKVKISGGGRCNATNNCPDPKKLIEFYPRGNPWLQSVFHQFSVNDTLAWFQKEGVKMNAEPDGRMFPSTNDSQTIIDALHRAAFRNPGFELRLHSTVKNIQPIENHQFRMETSDGSLVAKNVLIATGGFPSISGFDFLKTFQLPIVPPVPSLFTFNTKPHLWAALQGVSLPDVKVSLLNSPYHFSGPVLVTHWGFSGPAVLKLSAFGARFLAERNYKYRFAIHFLPEKTKQEIMDLLQSQVVLFPKKSPLASSPFAFPKSLWTQFCLESGLDRYHNWAETGKKAIQKMADLIDSHPFDAEGKTTYKDEFVTSGGVDLSVIEASTCESKSFPGLYFAGEVLNVDGITGGFNFQAAWSTAAAVAKNISKTS